MAHWTPLHPAPDLPPLRPARFAAAHGVAATRVGTLAPDTARLTRLAVSLAALALPALGLAHAEMANRAGRPAAPQAAAPAIPPRGAAAPQTAGRAAPAGRTASLTLTTAVRP